MADGNRAREDWIDYAKGAGIILVVFGHDWRGLAEAGILTDNSFFRLVDLAIFNFHMPLFFFLSGWVLAGPLWRRPEGLGRWQKLGVRILYPMVLWTYIFILVKILAGSATNAPVGWDEMRRWPVPGYLHLWFLWALAVMQATIYCLAPLIRISPKPVLWSGFVLSLVWSLWGGALPHLIENAVKYAPFYLCGILCGLYRLRPDRSGAGIVFACLCLFVMAEAGAMFLPASLLATYGVFLSLGALFGFLGLLGQGTLYLGNRGRAVLLYLGLASMTIYLMHTIFSAATRIVLAKADVHSLMLHLCLGVLAGLCLPLLMQSRFVPSIVSMGLGLSPLSGQATNAREHSSLMFQQNRRH